MLEVRQQEEKCRSLLKIGDPAIPTQRQMKTLLNSMFTMLNPKITDELKEVANLSKSVFEVVEVPRFIETFRGETIRIANYNVFYRTIQFAKQYFANKSKKNVLLVMNSETSPEIQVLVEDIKIFQVSFHYYNSLANEVDYNSIDIEFVRTHDTYEELVNFYTKEVNNLHSRYCELKADYPNFNLKGTQYSYHAGMGEEKMIMNECAELPNKIKMTQQRLQNIIKLGKEGIININQFYEEYVKCFSIDLKQKCSWYEVHETELKELF